MDVALYVDVAARGKFRIVLLNKRHLRAFITHRVFRAIDEPRQIPVFQITEAVNLFDDRDTPAKFGHDFSCQHIIQVTSFRTDVKQQVACCRRRLT